MYTKRRQEPTLEYNDESVEINGDLSKLFIGHCKTSDRPQDRA